jgi:calcineurin-like phosphoesterase family protein
MTQNSFFISDTHFGHTNIIHHSHRPFASIEEMDERFIENWNGVVKKGDNVYHLGDFAWRNAEDYRKRLNGNIHLIKGNHERAAEKVAHLFIWVKDVHRIKIGEQRIFLSHYSHEVWNQSHRGVWHVYGHSHGSLADNPKRRSIDVGVDATARRHAGISIGGAINFEYETLVGTKLAPEAYRPISFEEVAAIMAFKRWEPIDHHVVDCG